MKSVKQWYSMKAAEKTAEIYIYDEIGAGFFGGVSAKQFVDDLNKIGKVDTINLYLNSPGGDVFDGVAIYNALKRNKAQIDVHIDGLAASITSVIAMVGNSITIAENGMIMIHDPWTFAIGNSVEMRKQADVLDQVGGTLVNTYTARTGIDAEEVKALMGAETWLDADQAVAKGFADKKSPSVKMAAHFDLSRFRNVPRDVAAAPSKPDAPTFKSRISEQEKWLAENRAKYARK